MFVLAELKDTVKIPPKLFNNKRYDSIVEALNRKYANKVVMNLGLCICLHSINKMEDSFIFPQDGSSHTVVFFNMVVFRPFMDESFVAKVRSSSKEGVHVTCDFFDDFFVPSDALQQTSRFDEKEQLWVWDYSSEDQKHELFMDIGEEIRIRVVEQKFVDTTPSRPDILEGASPAEVPDAQKKSPYSLIASINESGLGLTSWWTS